MNGSNGFAYDDSAWAQSMNIDQVDPAFLFDGAGSVPPVNQQHQQGYGASSQPPATYNHDQSQLGGYGSGYHQQTIPDYDQFQHLAQDTNIQHNSHVQTDHHVQGTVHLNDYSQYSAGHSASPANPQIGYPPPHTTSSYLQHTAGGQVANGYNSPHTSHGYVQQNAGSQHSATGLQQTQQSPAQFFSNQTHAQQAYSVQQPRVATPQQHVPAPQHQFQAQQQAATIQQQRIGTPQQQAPAQQQLQSQQQVAPIQQQRVATPQQQLPAQQQQFQVQQQHGQAPQQRVQVQQHQGPAPLYQAQSVAQQATPTVQQQRPVQLPAQPSAGRIMPVKMPSTSAQFNTYLPPQPQSGLVVPDRDLRATPSAVAPNTTNSERWVGMHNAFVSNIPVKAAKNSEVLVPVFGRPEKRRLFSEKPLLIPAEAMGRFIDSLGKIAKDDPQAGVKHRARRLVLEYELRRVDAFDEDVLGSYEKPPKGKPSKMESEARRRNIDYPPLASLEEIPELEMLGMKTAAILELPTTWTPGVVLIKRVAADVTELLVDLVKKLRALPAYKELPNAIVANKGKTPSAEESARIKKLRAAGEKGREKVRRVVATALQVADDHVFGALDPVKLVPLFSVVINLFNTDGVSAPLTKALLNFASRLPFLDDSLIEAFKWPKLLPKLEDRGDDEVKTAVRKIKEVVKSNKGKPPKVVNLSSTAAANGEGTYKNSSSKVGTAKTGNGAANSSTSAPSSKRPREDDSEGRVTKKPATDQRASPSQLSASQSSSTQPSQNLSQRTTTTAGPAKSASSSILGALKVRASTGALPGKTRPPVKAASKLEAVKSERSDSENKLPGNTQPQTHSTSQFEISRPSTTPSTVSTTKLSKMSSEPKKEELKAEASRSSSSGFAALMSEIEKPKAAKRPAPTPKPDEPRADETDAERQRRLRKEERRRLNLRVLFKSEPDLTAIRIFHKEETEDEERDDHMIRDANDDKAEGRLLKASRSSQIDTAREWEEPALIDFTVISEQQRCKTFETRGGYIKVETEQQKIMAEKEKTELMVIYTDPRDIPASAMSPHPDTETDIGPSGVVVGPIRNIQARAALWTVMGPRGCIEQLLRRPTMAANSLAAKLVNKVVATNPYQNYGDPEVRKAKDGETLKLLTSNAVRNYVDPEPADPLMSKIRRDYADPAVQAASRSIELIVAELAGLPSPPQEPPTWQQDPTRREEWITGYSNDMRVREANQQAAQQIAISAQVAAQDYPPAQQQDAYAHFYAQMAAQAAQAAGQQQASPDPVAAALAALQAATAQPAQAPQFDPAQQAFMAAFANQTAQQAQGQQAPAVDQTQALQLAMWAASAGMQPPQAQQFLGAPQPGYGQDNNHPGYGSNTAQPGYGQDSDQLDYGDDHRNRGDREGRRGGKDSGPRTGGGTGASDEDHLRGINRSLIGTKPCTFWARGNCNRGDKCTFRHG